MIEVCFPTVEREAVHCYDISRDLYYKLDFAGKRRSWALLINP